MITEPILIQIGLSALLFLLMWAFFGNLVAKPFINIIEQREEKTVDAFKRIELRKEEIIDLQEELDDERRSAEVAGVSKRDYIISKAKKEAYATLNSAREQATAQVERARTEMAQAETATLAKALPEVRTLARELVDELLRTGDSNKNLG